MDATAADKSLNPYLTPKSDTASLSNGNSHPQAPTTCTNCRSRKIKCDRRSPCSNCIRSEIDCLPSIPLRVPRGRQGGRKRAKGSDVELLERIAKLERMVRGIETQKTQNPSQTQKTPKWESAQEKSTLDHYHHSTEGFDLYMGSSFWVALSQEISGLKNVLIDSSNAEDDGKSEHTPPSILSGSGQQHELPNHSNFVISRTLSTEIPQHPTSHQIYTLCDIYLANVDPVSKLLHARSLRAYLQEGSETLDCSPGPRGLEALRFAISYVAIISISEEECKDRLGEDRAVLLARYRAGTESALARADFVTTTEMSTLQALTIYLVCTH
jgi:Fungal Zn(2)-Cys(6) binuclear cluster domain